MQKNIFHGVLGIVGLIDDAVNRNKYKVTTEGFKKEQERIKKLNDEGLIS